MIRDVYFMIVIIIIQFALIITHSGKNYIQNKILETIMKGFQIIITMFGFVTSFSLVNTYRNF